MKKFVLITLGALAAAMPAQSQVSPIRIAVEQNSKTEAKPKAQWDKTQVRSLKITLTNNSAEPADGLVVKYWFMGREMTGSEVKVLKEGERKASLAARGKEVVDSESVSASYVEAHTEISKGGSYGAAKKVPASGQKIMGYAVKVLQGDKVLAETYSEPSYREKLAPPKK